MEKVIIISRKSNKRLQYIFKQIRSASIGLGKTAKISSETIKGQSHQMDQALIGMMNSSRPSLVPCLLFKLFLGASDISHKKSKIPCSKDCPFFAN